jgi:hypothetical protein
MAECRRTPAVCCKINHISSLSNSSGYSLYLVSVILVIIGMLFTVTLRAGSGAHMLAISHVHQLQARLLAESGIARAEYFLNGGDGNDLAWQTERFDEELRGYGSIQLSCRQFGLSAGIISTGNRMSKKYSKEGLAWRDTPEELAPVLTLSGHVGGVVLDKGSSVDGAVVLHHGEVVRGKRRDRIPGSVKWTIIRESPPFPFDREPVITVMNRMTDVVTSVTNGQGVDTAAQMRGYGMARAVVRSGDYDVSEKELVHTMIIASGTIRLRGSTQCRDVVVLGKEVVIEGGITERCLFFSQGRTHIVAGTHASQFFATDSIIVEKEAFFPLHSVWVAHRELIADTALSGGLYFPGNAVIRGHCFVTSDTIPAGTSFFSGPSIVLGKRSAFSGSLVTDGDIDMQSSVVSGQIWARSITTKNENVVYKNWLIDCDLKPLKQYVPFPLTGSTPANVQFTERETNKGKQ